MNTEHHDAHGHDDAHGHHHPHIVPPKVYAMVFLALMVFMAITVAVSFFDLGYFNLPIALTIAVIKTTLIIMFFMEVKYGSRLLWVFVCSSFIFLLIMFFMTMNDYWTRGWSPTGL